MGFWVLFLGDRLSCALLILKLRNAYRSPSTSGQKGAWLCQANVTHIPGWGEQAARLGYWTQATALNLTILKKPLNLEVLGLIIKASDKVSPSDLLYMNKLLEFSTNTKLDAPNATLEGKIA